MRLTRRQASLSMLSLATAAVGLKPARAAAPVRIGTILSVTGPAAFLGQDMRDGAQLAVDEINAGGGIDGRPIEWIFDDAQSETQRAIAATRRLLTSDRVDMIVGGGSMSGIALAMSAMVETAKVPFMATEGAAAIVSPAASHRWSFKSTVDDDLVLQRLADYFAKKKITRIGLLADTSGFGQGAAAQLRTVAPQRGLEAVYESFGPGDTDLVPQLGRLRDAGVQAIICWTVTPAGVVFLKQAAQLELDDRIQLIHSYGFVAGQYMRLAGPAAGRLLLVSQKFVVGDQLPESDPSKPKIAALTAAFQARFKRTPNQFVAQTYDAIHLAARALGEGGSDRERVRQALEDTRDVATASGVFSFSADKHSGLSKTNLVLVNWADERFNLVDDA